MSQKHEAFLSRSAVDHGQSGVHSCVQGGRNWVQFWVCRRIWWKKHLDSVAGGTSYIGGHKGTHPPHTLHHLVIKYISTKVVVAWVDWKWVGSNLSCDFNILHQCCLSSYCSFSVLATHSSFAILFLMLSQQGARSENWSERLLGGKLVQWLAVLCLTNCSANRAEVPWGGKKGLKNLGVGFVTAKIHIDPALHCQQPCKYVR